MNRQVMLAIPVERRSLLPICPTETFMPNQYHINQLVIEDCKESGLWDTSEGFEFYAYHPDNDHIHGWGHDELEAVENAQVRVQEANGYVWVNGRWVKT